MFSDDSDPIIDEIYFLYNAQEQWTDYASRSVRQRKEGLEFPELYNHELDSWLVNELSWENVEPMFRKRLKSEYSVGELSNMSEFLREASYGRPVETGEVNYPGRLFNIGVAVAQVVYGQLIPRLERLQEEYEVPDGMVDVEIDEPAESNRMPLVIPDR